jgi:hypothetical protein
LSIVLVAVVGVAGGLAGAARSVAPHSLLANHLLITWYGNPRGGAMGVLGEQSGTARVEALRRQAAAYEPLTRKRVLPAYHLVAVVALCTPGADGLWRRRETPSVIDALLAEARANGFRLILDVQPGRAKLLDEVQSLAPYLRAADIDLAIDPEFHLAECELPGRDVGATSAADVNAVLDLMERLVRETALPGKVLILHQYRWDMLPDKDRIRTSRLIDIVLNMDGFGSPALKRASYRDVMRQPLAYAGIKLFFRHDTDLLSPEDVMRLTPEPSVVVYQ